MLERIFISDVTGNEIMMMLAHGASQTNDLQLHRPEVCYPAFGYQLSNDGPLSRRRAGRGDPRAQVRRQRTGPAGERRLLDTDRRFASDRRAWAAGGAAARRDRRLASAMGVLARLSTPKPPDPAQAFQLPADVHSAVPGRSAGRAAAGAYRPRVGRCSNERSRG